YVVEAQEATLEDVVALAVLAIDPPGEVQEQLVEDALEERVVGAAAHTPIDLEHAPGSPGMDRRIDVAEVPLVCRQLSVGVHVPLASHQQQLGLGEAGVDQRQR